MNPNRNNNTVTKRGMLHMKSRTSLLREEDWGKAHKKEKQNVVTSSNEPSTAANRNMKRTQCKFVPIK